MAIQKTIHVGSKDIPMRASALIPRLYRVKFGRDMIRDMKSLQDSYNDAKADEEKDLTVYLVYSADSRMQESILF